MKLAVIGNGPSATGCGEQADALDFVVRCNAYWDQAAPGVGAKVSAWAWFGMLFVPPRPPPGQVESWATLPPSRCRQVAKHCGDMVAVVTCAAGRPIRWVTEQAWRREFDAIARFSAGANPAPSTGFTAVDMAIRLGPDELHIWGFDAVRPELPGWGDGSGMKWPGHADKVHSAWAEKLVLAELADKHVWLGEPCAVPLVWHNRPEALT